MNWKFWEKNESFDMPLDIPSQPFSADPMHDPGLPKMDSAPQPLGETPLGISATPPDLDPVPMRSMEPEPPMEPKKANLHDELILARLDAIKNQLDLLNQRIANLERSQLQQQSNTGQQQRGPWYRN